MGMVKYTKTNMKFENPYKPLAEGEKTTVNFDISLADKAFLQSTRPGAGTLSGVLGILTHKICNELRKRNITDYSRLEEFESFVLNCSINDGVPNGGLPDRSLDGSLPQGTPPPLTGGTERTSNHNPPASTIVPDLQGGSGTESKGEKRVKAGKGKVNKVGGHE